MAARPPDPQSLGVEARALLDVLAAKLETAARPADPTGSHPRSAPEPEPPPATAHPPRCTGCPVCVAISYLADHRELSAQLAQGALLIVGAVRQYLDHSPVTSPAPSSIHPALRKHRCSALTSHDHLS